MANRVAAIDVGLKRIGTAICLDGKIVLPQNPILRKNRNQAARDVSTFLREWNVDTLIVGIPDGSSKEEMQRRIRHFVSLLDFNGNIEYIDEGFTSHEAKEATKGVIKHKKDGKIDSIAAQKILERWLLGR
ncbi:MULTISPECIES: Holliday junction resolvase RuvX [unclassified Nitratiruptor]|uniref:Holliday junction resolvase RuvX n=1 Tax=unclassified Nitratiruptor TaxID=2624044 RepID=UPI0019165E4F|nr:MULTISPECIES: Holliday junction resolvase RuvX [unclassified Nitratiruptor]BCD60400.1 putative Holliday junction resolvase [Nitratiruptor sp. YY08-10]BCD64111.1 putative Holliday junction resolvase [Nitratiruptor sp. YY08-14]